jgi:transcriptional regulator with XRE-family HTH domain
MLGIARVNLTKTINGNPTVETLEKIAAALNVSIIELFEANTGDLTALIDFSGKLYRVNSIYELESLILQFKGQI